jgi:hypothetical protein
MRALHQKGWTAGNVKFQKLPHLPCAFSKR